MAIKCLVFDCDGVLIDSVHVKTHAFARLVEAYPKEQQQAFVDYHQKNGGVSRYKKFAWFFENFLDHPITPEESESWGNKFSAICFEELLKCKLIAGTLDTLTFWQGKLPLYVCSGAPGAEQREVLTSHNLAKYFQDILGSPPAKAELLAQIVDLAHVSPKETLMVGDATTDLNAARQVGTLFYGVGDLLKGGDYPWGPDLQKITQFILDYNEANP